MKQKKIEWKDTKLDFCVDYNYSLFVRNRCVFFYGETSKWRKTLSYASNFVKPWNICVIYLYGEEKWREETFSKYINDFKGNLIVIRFDIDDNYLSIFSKYREWIKKKTSAGEIKDGEFTKNYLAERNRIEKAVSSGALGTECISYEKYQNDRAMVKTYEKAIQQVDFIQRKEAQCYSTFLSQKSMCANEGSMIEAIRQCFPFGVENDTTNTDNVKISKIRRYIASALEGNKEMEIKLRDEEIQLSFFDFYTSGASEIVDTIRNYCHHAVSERGRFYLAEIWSIIEKPPYGAYDCNWYMYLFAYALAPYFLAEYHYMCLYFPVQATDINFKNAIKGKYGVVFTLTEASRKLAALVTYVFGGEKTIYVSQALSEARQYCEKNIQTPLSFIDKRFYELIEFNPDKWTKKGEAEKYLSWFETSKEALRSSVKSIDRDFDKELEKKYDPERIRLFRKFSYVKGGAVGWLHSVEMFMERVEEYMKIENVCRECGRPIRAHTAYVLSDNSSPTRVKHDELVFKTKDIIGLNKKFLGRYQNEYFCVRCLCEVLELDEEQLHERMENFRSEGCTLF